MKSKEAATDLLSPRELLGVGAVSPTDSPRTSPEGSRGAELFQQKVSYVFNGLRYKKYENSIQKISFITTEKKTKYSTVLVYRCKVSKFS